MKNGNKLIFLGIALIVLVGDEILIKFKSNDNFMLSIDNKILTH